MICRSNLYYHRFFSRVNTTRLRSNLYYHRPWQSLTICFPLLQQYLDLAWSSTKSHMSQTHLPRIMSCVHYMLCVTCFVNRSFSSTLHPFHGHIYKNEVLVNWIFFIFLFTILFFPLTLILAPLLYKLTRSSVSLGGHISYSQNSFILIANNIGF